MGPKDLRTPAHFILGPWSMPRRKKCPRTNKENPDCQGILPRTTLPSTGQNHGKRKSQATRGSLLEHPKGNPEHSGPAIEAIPEETVTSALNIHS